MKSRLILLLVFLVPTMRAQALSCAQMRDQYVFSCAGHRCSAAFSAIQIPAFAACDRRLKVAEINPKVAAFLIPLLEASDATTQDGMYTFSMTPRYWSRVSSEGSDTEFFKDLTESLVEYGDRESTDLQSMSPRDVAQLLDKRFGNQQWLQRDTTYSSVQDAREALEHQARNEFAKSILQGFLYWAGFVVVFCALIQSVHVYFSRLYRKSGEGATSLRAPLVVQFLIAALGIAPAVMMPWDVWPGTLLVPAVVVILLAESWARFRKSRARPVR